MVKTEKTKKVCPVCGGEMKETSQIYAGGDVVYQCEKYHTSPQKRR